MNRQIKVLGAVIMLCYLAAFVKLNQIQVVNASDYNDRPENTRAQLRDFNRPRGDIVSADGVVLAESEERRAELRYQRVYPEGDLYAHITGYYSLWLGSTGVERVYNAELTGRTTTLQFRSLSDILSDPSTEGNVVLTVDTRVQEAARDALSAAGLTGSVVALDPRDGGIYAMYSTDSFDPNLVSINDQAAAVGAKSLLDLAERKPMLSRAYQERFFPGSTFKVVTAAAGLTSGLVTPTAPVYPAVDSYTPPGTNRPIYNFNRQVCGGNLFEILQRSCNAAFAEMAAAQLGPDPMIDASEATGFNEAPPIDLTRPAASSYPTDFGSVVSRPEGQAPVYEDSAALAQTAIGQNDVAATPLQMALVAAGVANGGEVMTPHVMSQIEARDGDVVASYDPAVWRTAMSPDVASVLRDAMVSVVEEGTAGSIRLPGFEVGGKTGTAQLGVEPPRSHAWMIAFAGPQGQPATVAVAVMVESIPGGDGQTGGRVAGPVAKAVLEAALAVA